MSFATVLETTTALGAEYSALDSNISSMACAADHDPSWGPADEVEFARVEARRAEVTRLLAVAFSELVRDHREAWQGFLIASTERLDALVYQTEVRTHAEYERDKWTLWSRGVLPVGNQPEAFARGLRMLTQHRDLIDRLLGKVTT